MDLLALFIFLVVLWWNDSGGYHMQRMGSCKDERHSILATLFLAVFQTSRAWLWIGVALVSIVLFPDLSDTPYGTRQAYPMVMNAYLGPGIKGLLVTGFLAAFMSTIDTHLNWGASYVMTDLYRRFLRKEASQQHYMRVTKIVVVLLMLGASLIAPLFKSVTAAWEFLALTQAGVGLIAVLAGSGGASAPTPRSRCSSGSCRPDGDQPVLDRTCGRADPLRPPLGRRCASS